MPTTCPCCGQAIRKPRAKAVIEASTDPLDILMPVPRKKIGKDKITIVVATTFRDGEEMRFSVSRNPKDSESAAVEIGRRLAVLARVADTCRFLVARLDTLRDEEPARVRASIAGQKAANAIKTPPSMLEWLTLPNGRRVLAPPATRIAAAIADVVACNIAAPAVESLYAAE